MNCVYSSEKSPGRDMLLASKSASKDQAEIECKSEVSSCRRCATVENSQLVKFESRKEPDAT